MSSPYCVDFAPPQYDDAKELQLRDSHVENWERDFLRRMKELRLKEQQWMATTGKDEWGVIKEMQWQMKIVSPERNRWDIGSTIRTFTRENEVDVDGLIGLYSDYVEKMTGPVESIVAFMTPILDEMCKLMTWDEHAEKQRTLLDSAMSFGYTFLQLLMAKIPEEHRQTLIDLAKEHFEVSELSDDHIYDRVLLAACGIVFDDEKATFQLIYDALVPSIVYKSLKLNADSTISYLPAHSGVKNLIRDAQHLHSCEIMEAEEEQWATGNPRLLEVTRETECIDPYDYDGFTPEQRTHEVNQILASVHPSLQAYAKAHMEKKIFQSRIRLLIPKQVLQDIRVTASNIIVANAYVVTVAGWAERVISNTRFIIESSKQLIVDIKDMIALVEAKRRPQLSSPEAEPEPEPEATGDEIVDPIADLSLEADDAPSGPSGEVSTEPTAATVVEEGGKQETRKLSKRQRLERMRFYKYLSQKLSRPFIDRILFRRSVPTGEAENSQSAAS